MTALVVLTLMFGATAALLFVAAGAVEDGASVMTALAYAFLALSLVCVVILVFALLRARRLRARNERLRRFGLGGRARVLSADVTGVVVLGAALVDVELAVDVDGRPSFTVRRREAIPHDLVERWKGHRIVDDDFPPDDLPALLAARSPVPVFLDRDRADDLLVDWPRT